jgi:hypothetical protein
MAANETRIRTVSEVCWYNPEKLIKQHNCPKHNKMKAPIISLTGVIASVIFTNAVQAANADKVTVPASSQGAPDRINAFAYDKDGACAGTTATRKP